MLEIQNVSKTFNAGTVNQKTALNGLNLKLNEGDFVTVIGGNGAGKSTMLNAVAGVWPVDEGKIIIDGVDVTRLSEHQRAAYIGRVFQDPMTGTAATMQIEENLALAARRGKPRTLRIGITKAEREQYRELLKTLGFALFNRGKNGVSMTSYGASLYPSIRDVLNSDEALKQSIARLNGLEKGKVKLGVFNSVCASLLPGLLKSFMTHYPQIEIEVYQGTYDDVKEWLRTGQVDIAFLSSTCREEFNLTELFREPLLCIVPQDWPEPENGVMTPALMNGQSFVVQCDATDAEMRQFLKKYKIGTERRCHVIDDQSNIAMVEAGLGISIMPQMLLRDCKAAIKIYPIEPEEDRVVGLAVQRPAAMAPAVEQMFHHIVDYCRQIELR